MKKLVYSVLFFNLLILASCSDDDSIAIETEQPDNEVISGNITENTVWTKDNVYTLEGKVIVDGGATLTIEAGTLIKGAEGVETQASALIIDRDAKLIANGTADEPIIFTSVLDEIEPGDLESPNLTVDDRGLWGGLIILGNAPVSLEGDVTEQLVEGIPPGSGYGLYGGDNPNDNSGSIQYVSLRHGGANIGEGNEINGFTTGGVGSGTYINHIEVIANLDDGVEFFGGTHDASNIIVWGVGDDSVDLDQAYSGTINNVAIVQTNVSDHGLEIDGPEGEALTGEFTLNNVTIFSDNSVSNANSGNREYAQFRSNAMGSINNILLIGGTQGTDFTLQDDENVTENYNNAKLTFSNIEVVLPSSASGLEDVFIDSSGLTSFTSDANNFANIINNIDDASVGSDLSVFEWSWTYQAAEF